MGQMDAALSRGPPVFLNGKPVMHQPPLNRLIRLSRLPPPANRDVFSLRVTAWQRRLLMRPAPPVSFIFKFVADFKKSMAESAAEHRGAERKVAAAAQRGRPSDGTGRAQEALERALQAHSSQSFKPLRILL